MLLLRAVSARAPTLAAVGPPCVLLAIAVRHATTVCYTLYHCVLHATLARYTLHHCVLHAAFACYALCHCVLHATIACCALSLRATCYYCVTRYHCVLHAISPRAACNPCVLHVTPLRATRYTWAYPYRRRRCALQRQKPRHELLRVRRCRGGQDCARCAPSAPSPRVRRNAMLLAGVRRASSRRCSAL